MKKQISLLVLSLVLTLSFTVTATELKEAKVVSVIDGDTIKVRLKTGTTEVRYTGIDTPETRGEVERYGEEAKNYNKNLVADKTVWLELGEKERDQEDRLLAYVYLDKAKKSMVNAILLAQGYAEALTNSSSDGVASNKTVIYFFKMKGCPHCAEEEPFLEELQEKYPSLVVVDKEVSGNQENLELLKKMGQEYGREVRGVPATFIGKDVWVGFAKKIEKQIEEKVKYCTKNHCVNPMVKLKGGNHEFADTFEELERDAKEDERGLWSKDSTENNE
ncbi:thermonuclease family protein [Candidatus Bipolaricaulota bacterium]|nr:thermonuclease family protein [Candidatus Bipolaricaulota bacterium]